MSRVIIGLGSNIHPHENIKRAKSLLARYFTVRGESRFQMTKPYGPVNQADFLNGSVLIETNLNMNGLKESLETIESELGRVKSGEHWGPRTIDLDIVVWNGSIIDNHFYERDYLKESVLELLPDLNY